MKPWKFVILTFGCKVNQYESQSVRECWQSHGGEETDSPAEADFALINSCAITARAERDARAALYRLEREAPHCRRLLTGCSASLLAADPGLRGLCHGIFPVVEKARLLADPRHLPAARAEEAPPRQEGAYPPFQIRAFRRARPVLKVQEGCTHRCTYCIVPSMRPVASSRPVDEAVAEARRLLEAGHREIMISGINLLLYGRDFSTPTDFWTLIAALERELAPEWAGRARFRISSLEPKQLQGRGLELLAESRMLCPHLHVSLQSGSPAVLRRMGRGHYRPELLADALAAIVRARPRFGLGADILMGFPGEKEEHVRETLALVDALPFTYAHVFPYSRRPGTAADSFPDHIPQPEKAARAARVRERIRSRQLAFWQQAVQTQAVLEIATDSPDEHRPGSPCKGVDQCYMPCLLDTAPAAGGHGLIRARAAEVTPGGVRVALL